MVVNRHFTTITKCRISESSELLNILHLGEQPHANALKKNQKENEEKFPLSISFCEESSARSHSYLNYCGINNEQIEAIIDNNSLKQGLFSPDYRYL